MYRKSVRVDFPIKKLRKKQIFCNIFIKKLYNIVKLKF